MNEHLVERLKMMREQAAKIRDSSELMVSELEMMIQYLGGKNE